MIVSAELPSVSVVIPCYNAERWIARAVQSVLAQGYPGLELFVVDDGSIDRSVEMVRAFGDKLHYEAGPNRGACVARNRGLELSSGDYVLFLDADDYIEPGSLRHWVKAAVDTQADVVFGPYSNEFDGARSEGVHARQSANSADILQQWLEGWFTPPCSVLWRRSFVQSIGGWNVEALRRQDSELALRGLLNGAEAAISNEGKGIYVQHDSADRISRRGGQAVLEWELRSLRDLWALAKCGGRESVRQGFSVAFYRLAYDAFFWRIDDVGELALAEARTLGLTGHVGSVMHRSVANVIGLRRKMHISSMLRGRTVR